jgi:DNA polymerase-3 subunit gamma/tau
VGKTTAARILAMALNCERKGEAEPPGEPCGHCANCERIWTGSANLDVVEIDAASNRGVDDARDLRERAMYAASREGAHKVYIVDEAHMLTREAWNALLKILEEPPPGVVFVFATTEPQKIANTAAPVLSRLQRFDFRRIGPAAIRDRLRTVLVAEGIEADEDALTLIARQADGGMRDALSVLDQCLSFGEGRVTAGRVREVLGLVDDAVMAELLRVVVERDPAGVFALLDRLDESGADLVEFMAGAGETLRALLMLQVGARPEGLTEAMHEVLARSREALATGDLLRMLRLLGEGEAGIRRSGSPRLMVETLLLRWVLMDRTVELESVLASGGAGSKSERPAGAVGAGLKSERPSGVVGAGLKSERPSGAVRAESMSERPSGAVGAAARTAPIPFTLEALLAAWPDLVASARDQSRFLGEALAGSRPELVEPPAIALRLAPGNPMHGETLVRQREGLEQLLGRAVGGLVRVAIREGEGTAAPRTRRLSEAETRSERLSLLTARDPALEAAAESLDLEVME